MNRILLSRTKLGTLTQLNSTAIFNSPKLLPSFSRLNFLSSSPNSEDTPNLPESSSDDLPTDISTQELKNRIDRYLKGDMEVLPSIFEGILARKLSGKHDDTDDELMEEFQSKTHQLFLSDDDLTESDEAESDKELSD